MEYESEHFVCAEMDVEIFIMHIKNMISISINPSTFINFIKFYAQKIWIQMCIIKSGKEYV